ncbi:MAG: hypothetical protein K0S04_2520 [Herbinix sp.]|jgi:hypothetical protein|nr:hypothetical protein [Herbinix sp.]
MISPTNAFLRLAQVDIDTLLFTSQPKFAHLWRTFIMIGVSKASQLFEAWSTLSEGCIILIAQSF